MIYLEVLAETVRGKGLLAFNLLFIREAQKENWIVQVKMAD